MTEKEVHEVGKMVEEAIESLRNIRRMVGELFGKGEETEWITKSYRK